MQQKYSRIVFNFVWQFAIVLGLSMSANSHAVGQYNNIDQRIFVFQNQNSDLVSFEFNVEDNGHTPIPDSPAEESSSNEENSEEENVETSDSEFDGELSHYQLDGFLNPLIGFQETNESSLNFGNYKIPLYILFHCWKNFLS